MVEEQKYIFKGDTHSVIERFADKIDELPYDVLFTQFEGNDEAFFSFSMEAPYEEYNALILSMISLMIKEDEITASAISSASSFSYSTIDSLALVKQTNRIAKMFLDCGFEINHEHEHHHDHDDECNCHDHHIH